MRKIKFLRIVSILSLALTLVLTGCNASQANSEQDGPELKDYEASVFDRELTEGKMAVYYMSSGLNISTWYNSTSGGDLMLLIMPDGTTALLDCGHQGEGAHVVNRLKALGIDKLDYFIVSHPHTDHIGGYSIVMRHMDVGHVYMPPVEVMERADNVGLRFIADIEEMGIPYTHLASGDTFEIAKDVTVKVYNPEIGFDADKKINLNESSLLMKFVYKESSFLMNGDISNNTIKENGYDTEIQLVNKWGDELQADVSKIGHHGNADAMSTSEWRAAVDAKIYVTMSTFPRDLAEHMKNVNAGAVSLNTALDGDLVIYTDGDGTYDIQVSKDRTIDGYELLETKDGFMHVE
ncbi:MAG: MBL fold metallo-hydrolase [Tyzzerella sp.]|nr:MBL fold metallo-hydrolase [Tyzzerella sp.]